MSTTTNIGDLFTQAQKDGVLSPTAMQALVTLDTSTQLPQALGGIDVDDVPFSEVVLLTIQPDDSGSIAAAGNEEVMCDGHNMVLDAVAKTKQRDNIFVSTRLLNGTLINPYRPLDEAERMYADGPKRNYNANHGTPLYDNAVLILGQVLAESLQFEQNGVVVRTITVFETDGEDLHSRKYRAQDVAGIVVDMRRAESHIVIGLYVGPNEAEGRRIFHSMGIDDKWVLTPGDDPHKIRDAMQMVSQSVATASQTATGFSQAQAGGFATP